MINTLILLAHPNLEASLLNKKIIKSLQNIENIEIRDLYKLYPDFRINVEIEQRSLKKADLIIFQFPLYWYSTPSLLKKWQDEVLSYGFAHGKKHKLEKKYFLLSFTIGSFVENYEKKEYNGKSKLDNLLSPLESMATYCKMIYKGYVFSDFKLNVFNSMDKKIKKAEHAKEIKKKIIFFYKEKKRILT